MNEREDPSQGDWARFRPPHLGKACRFDAALLCSSRNLVRPKPIMHRVLETQRLLGKA